MRELIDTLIEYGEEHWIKVLTGVAMMLVGWFFGRRKAQADWRNKQFFDRLNVSLTSIQDGRLLIRTILEKRCEDVFLNEVATEAVVKSAQSTTAEDPLLPLPKDDYWYYLNSTLNEIAEKFAVGQMRRDGGQTVECVTYLMCLTCECDGPIRTRKVRAMLIRRDLLTKLPEEQPKFESEHHITRWKTLKQMAASYEKTPHRFIEMELCF